jgi:hypothetical protein
MGTFALLALVPRGAEAGGIGEQIAERTSAHDAAANLLTRAIFSTLRLKALPGQIVQASEVEVALEDRPHLLSLGGIRSEASVNDVVAERRRPRPCRRPGAQEMFRFCS